MLRVRRRPVDYLGGNWSR